MIQPNLIITSKNHLKSGIYESYYFRGNHIDGNLSFWLKHNLIIFSGNPEIRFDSTIIIFDKQQKLSTSYQLAEIFSISDFEKQTQNIDSWDEFKFNFRNGSNISISNQLLKGKIQTIDGEVSWDLNLNPSNQTYYHFSKDWFYHGFFPKKKILTRDIDLTFNGIINTPSLKMEGNFKGLNGHNWGKEHAYRYAYGNCNQFLEDSNAYFDGFSAKITLGPGLIKSPFLSSCSLKTKKRWYHFNNVIKSYQHKVIIVDKYLWHVEFISSEFVMEVKIEGLNVPWIELNYDHPSRRISKVNNTKYANGSIIIKNRTNKNIVESLSSDFFELESLIP